MHEGKTILPWQQELLVSDEQKPDNQIHLSYFIGQIAISTKFKWFYKSLGHLKVDCLGKIYRTTLLSIHTWMRPMKKIVCEELYLFVKRQT